MTNKKKYFSSELVWGIKKRRVFYADSKFIVLSSKTKLWAKNQGKKCNFRKTQNSHSSWLITFFRNILLRPVQRI
jgi:hypothetical protein